MSETATLLPQDRQRELRKVEAELLSQEELKRPTTRTVSLWGIADSAGFLLGYMLLSVSANIYMFTNVSGNAGLFYMVNVLFSIIGLVGLAMFQPVLLFIYGGYLCASFLFSSVVSGGTIMFLMQSDVCQAIGDILSGVEIKEFCMASPVRFRIIALTTVFGELLLEMFVLWQTKRMHDHARGAQRSEWNKLPKGKLGSIAILQP
jgi:hypothetical protein